MLDTLDVVVIILYFVLTGAIGVGVGYFVNDLSDFFAGGGAIPWRLSAVSNYMTMMSAFIFVAHAGIAYEHGVVAILILWSAVPAALLGAVFLATRWKRAGLVTPVEYLELRYGPSVRQITSWVGVVFRVLDNMVRLYAIGVFVSACTNMSLETAVVVCGGVVVVYTMIGGLWAVVVTDTVQCVVLVMIALVMFPLSISAAGGWEGLREAVPDHFTLQGPKSAWSYLAVYYLMVSIKFNGNWAFIQRFYATENESAARKMGYFSAFLFLVFPVLFLTPAIAAAAILPGLENGEEAYVSICRHLLPSGAMGLMIAAMFAATMSTLSSEYNVTAAVLTKDMYLRLFRPNAGERESLLVARLMTLALGALVIVGAMSVERLGGAFEVNKRLTALVGVPLVIPLVFGIVRRGPKPWGAVLCIVSGIAVGAALDRWTSLDWQTATFLQFAWCFLVFGLSAIRPGKPSEYTERVDRFFERLQRAAAPNDDRRAMRSRRAIMRLFSISLFGCALLFALVGLLNAGNACGRLILLVTCGASVVACLQAYYAFVRRNGAEVPEDSGTSE